MDNLERRKLDSKMKNLCWPCSGSVPVNIWTLLLIICRFPLAFRGFGPPWPRIIPVSRGDPNARGGRESRQRSGAGRSLCPLSLSARLSGSSRRASRRPIRPLGRLSCNRGGSGLCRPLVQVLIQLNGLPGPAAGTKPTAAAGRGRGPVRVSSPNPLRPDEGEKVMRFAAVPSRRNPRNSADQLQRSHFFLKPPSRGPSQPF